MRKPFEGKVTISQQNTDAPLVPSYEFLLKETSVTCYFSTSSPIEYILEKTRFMNKILILIGWLESYSVEGLRFPPMGNNDAIQIIITVLDIDVGILNCFQMEKIHEWTEIMISSWNVWEGVWHPRSAIPTEASHFQ